jgi:hypothetical protein
LGALGTVTVDQVYPETRRGLLSVQLGASNDLQVLAPYLEASSVSGYWVPTEGPNSRFQQAHWFNLYGNSMDAEFFLAPASEGSDALEVVAIRGSDFFGDAAFCGFGVRIGDFADDLLASLEEVGYPCQLIVRRSENREFITSLTDLDSQVQLSVANNLINEVFVWLR